MPRNPIVVRASSELTDEMLEQMFSGQAGIAEALRYPCEHTTEFESLRSLAAHIKAAFQARLYFVSCRRVGEPSLATFPYDTAGAGLAAERTRWYGAKNPIDVAVAATCRPFLLGMNFDAAPGTSASPEKAMELWGNPANNLLLVPFQNSEVIALCAVHFADSFLGHDAYIEQLSSHCVLYLAEHFRHHAPFGKRRPSLLSPQEERVIIACADGLTDKEIGREMKISPHTVRAHLNNAKEKLQARNKTHAAILYAAMLAKS